MRILLSVLAITGVLTGCSTPSATTVNIPDPSYGLHRRMVLDASLLAGQLTETLSAHMFEDTIAIPFANNTVVSCDGVELINTIKSPGQKFQTISVSRTAGASNDWKYSGPDTTFEVLINPGPTLTITAPTSGTQWFKINRLPLQYTPMGPAESIAVSIRDNFSTIFTPHIDFDSVTGAIQPIQLDSAIGRGFGTLSMSRGILTRLSTYEINRVEITSETQSQTLSISWQ